MRLFVTSDSTWLFKISTASQKHSLSSLLLIQRGKDEELVMISPRGLRGGRGEAHTLVLVCSSEKTRITSIESLSFTSETLQVCTKVSLGVQGWGGGVVVGSQKQLPVLFLTS